MSAKTSSSRSTHSSTRSPSASHGSATSRELKHAAATEHIVAHTAYEVDRRIREVEVLSSGNPRRIQRYFLRKFAYKMFGKLMGKTINRL
jgi:hypothetical protein